MLIIKDCKHKFILPTPDKSIDSGTPIANCEHCGLQRQFKNSIEPDFNTRNGKMLLNKLFRKQPA